MRSGEKVKETDDAFFVDPDSLPASWVENRFRHFSTKSFDEACGTLRYAQELMRKANDKRKCPICLEAVKDVNKVGSCPPSANGHTNAPS